ncbi:hypothetical protein [Aliiroseovarius marinus]|uniref:COG3904 family protein n=1 Tax=Aliiroseovarius marinus TaxID=2500159 RepID=UPI003D7E06E0
MRYLKSHWQGKHPVVQSFWINAVGVRLAMVSFLIALSNQASLSPLLVLPLIAADLSLLVWQAVGYFRALDRHGTALGAQLPVWGGMIVLIVAVFVMMSLWWAVWLATDDPETPSDYAERRSQYHAGLYSLDVSQDGTSLALSGTISPGVTKAFRAALVTHPNLKTLLLDSHGGNVFEARGLAQLVLQNNLGTHVQRRCASSCTLVFMAGQTRILDAGAQLGFHRYVLEGNAALPLFDIEAEQQRDRQFLADRGVQDWFVDQAFETPPDQLWEPTRAELERGGVLAPLN